MSAAMRWFAATLLLAEIQASLEESAQGAEGMARGELYPDLAAYQTPEFLAGYAAGWRDARNGVARLITKRTKAAPS